MNGKEHEIKQFAKLNKNYKKYHKEDRQQNINYLEAQVIKPKIEPYKKSTSLFKKLISQTLTF